MANIEHHDQGDVWTPQATFKVGTTPTDPSQVTFKYRQPNGTITTVGPVAGGAGGSGINRISVGVFTYDLPLNAPGHWYARFEGTGSVTAAEDYETAVDPSVFYTTLSDRALVTLAETKDWLQQQSIKTSEDLELVRVINDVSDRFHFESGREFKTIGTNPQTRTFTVDSYGYCYQTVPIGDVSAVTTVQIIDSDWTTVVATVSSTDYELRPTIREAWEPARRIAFRRGVRTVTPGMRLTIAGSFGFPVVPGNVRQAVLDAIAYIVDRDVEHYRQDLAATTGTTEGTNVIVFAGRPQLLTLPPSALAVARSYQDSMVA
jgi:hypothetical protein